MTTEHVFECLRDFSNGGACLGSLDRESQEVLIAGLGGLTESVKNALYSLGVTRLLNRVNSVDLLLSDLRVVDAEDLEVGLLLGQAVLVDTHDYLCARIDLSLTASC